MEVKWSNVDTVNYLKIHVVINYLSPEILKYPNGIALSLMQRWDAWVHGSETMALEQIWEWFCT